MADDDDDTPTSEGGAQPEPAPPPPPPPPPMEFKNQQWLNENPLDKNSVFEYFALSPFYDSTCNNERLISDLLSDDPFDISQLSTRTGMEYVLDEARESINYFVIIKQMRDGPKEVTPMRTYVVLDGIIHQLAASQHCNLDSPPPPAGILDEISKALDSAASELEKRIGYVDTENGASSSGSNVTEETPEFEEINQPPATADPPPAAFQEPPSTTAEGEKDSEEEQSEPDIDQDPSKRIKL
ncbi:hypothetical protein ACH5RR_007987 [Cinchona calisaya]|uniref:Mediator of RNA polymerase II transcription subunit 6 n=1 Tax=Cinchona calisaya TaxID=153742 RepID=A0ABD3AA34_9GENT